MSLEEMAFLEEFDQVLSEMVLLHSAISTGDWRIVTGKLIPIQVRIEALQKGAHALMTGSMPRVRYEAQERRLKS